MGIGILATSIDISAVCDTGVVFEGMVCVVGKLWPHHEVLAHSISSLVTEVEESFYPRIPRVSSALAAARNVHDIAITRTGRNSQLSGVEEELMVEQESRSFATRKVAGMCFCSL